MASTEVEQLRAELRRSQRLVRAKMRRAVDNRVDWDIQANLSKVPLVNSNNIRRLNTIQLNAALNRQKSFRSRKTILVGDNRQRLLSPAKVRRYRENESKAIKRTREVERLIDFTNTNVSKAAEKATQPKPKQYSGDKFHTGARGRSSFGGVRGDKALDKLIGVQKKRASKKGQLKSLHNTYTTVNEILSHMGGVGNSIGHKLNGLSDEASLILVNDRPFWDSLVLDYELIKAGLIDSKTSSINGDGFHETALSTLDSRIGVANDRADRVIKLANSNVTKSTSKRKKNDIETAKKFSNLSKSVSGMSGKYRFGRYSKNTGNNMEI